MRTLTIVLSIMLIILTISVVSLMIIYKFPNNSNIQQIKSQISQVTNTTPVIIQGIIYEKCVFMDYNTNNYKVDLCQPSFGIGNTYIYILDPINYYTDPGYNSPREQTIAMTVTNPHGGFLLSITTGNYILVIYNIFYTNQLICYNNIEAYKTVRANNNIGYTDIYQEMLGIPININNGQSYNFNITIVRFLGITPFNIC